MRESECIFTIILFLCKPFFKNISEYSKKHQDIPDNTTTVVLEMANERTALNKYACCVKFLKFPRFLPKNDQ